MLKICIRFRRDLYSIRNAGRTVEERRFSAAKGIYKGRGL